MLVVAVQLLRVRKKKKKWQKKDIVSRQLKSLFYALHSTYLILIIMWNLHWHVFLSLVSMWGLLLNSADYAYTYNVPLCLVLITFNNKYNSLQTHCPRQACARHTPLFSTGPFSPVSLIISSLPVWWRAVRLSGSLWKSEEGVVQGPSATALPTRATSDPRCH